MMCLLLHISSVWKYYSNGISTGRRCEQIIVLCSFNQTIIELGRPGRPYDGLA